MDKPKTEKKQKKRSNRCLICNTKVGLMGFSCECSPDKFFCMKHRLPEEHSCTIDYTQKKDYLMKKLPKIEHEKVIKI